MSSLAPGTANLLSASVQGVGGRGSVWSDGSMTGGGTDSEGAPLLGSAYLGGASGVGTGHGKTAAAAASAAAEVNAARTGPIEHAFLWLAFIVQLGGVGGIPFYLSSTGAGLMESTLSAAAMLMISIAWVPQVQDRMVTPSDRNHPMNARTQVR
jgi:hypothetical protein